MSRTPIFSRNTIEDAYAAFCAEIVPMHRGLAKKKGESYRRPTKAAWIKANKDAYEAFQAEMNGNIEHAATLRGDGPLDLAQIIAEAVANALAAQTGEAEAELQFREVVEAYEVAEDLARNGVLWRLNKEGFLAITSERLSENERITQDDGTTLLTENFGPLPARS